MTDNFWDNAEIISHYSRKQAIADGVLVDLMQGEFAELVANAGFKIPVAMTAEAFSTYVELSEHAKRACNDIKGRLWDVLWMMRCQAKRELGASIIFFDFHCVTDRPTATPARLKCVCGPDDDGAPCLTIMLPEQD